MKKYIINENGVCTNPDKIGEVKSKKGTMFDCAILTAYFPDGKWRWGYQYHSDQVDGSGGGGYPGDSRTPYNTQREVILAAVKGMQNMIKIEEEYNPKLTFKTAHKCIQLAHSQFAEPTLF